MVDSNFIQPLSKPKNWFEEVFGFVEENNKFNINKEQFEFDEQNYILKSKANNKIFKVGLYENLCNAYLVELIKMSNQNQQNAKESFFQQQQQQLLQQQNQKQQQKQEQNEKANNLQGLTFSHIIGSAKLLHLDPANQEAVFQAASQFNCLEMVGPATYPDQGITKYINDKTQGPDCALACPAGTLYRNYFWNKVGQGGFNQKNQINNLNDIEKIIDNEKEKYFILENGYCLPQKQDCMPRLNQKLQDKMIYQDCFYNLKIGVHWDTEVYTGVNKKTHNVCQVYTSAFPVIYSQSQLNYYNNDVYEPFSRLILDSAYDSVLKVAHVLAIQKQKRIKVFLTQIGGGAFGNQPRWIATAIEKALANNAQAPLDVYLVHFRSFDGEYLSIQYKSNAKI